MKQMFHENVPKWFKISDYRIQKWPLLDKGVISVIMQSNENFGCVVFIQIAPLHVEKLTKDDAAPLESPLLPHPTLSNNEH